MLRQGFALMDDEIHCRNGLHAFKAIPRAFSLGAGRRVSVQIMFHDKKTVHYGGEPFSTFEGEGAGGSIQLPERVHGYSPLRRENTDNHIRIVVDGDEIYWAGLSMDGRGARNETPPATTTSTACWPGRCSETAVRLAERP